MAEDWDAVARAIHARLDELGLQVKELALRADVSPSIIGELRYNTIARRRSARTLEALSVGLEWEADHLARVLAGDAAGVVSSTESQRVRESLDALHLRLDVLADRVEGSDRVLRDLVSKVDDLHRLLAGDRNASR